eukprot:CAMPEP_0182907958 /NCGR_PEP_ID=MMETSP0034_2-20130328/34882_1 /TAXON_ID=156128 /ORGANISM="Nephroselmis pyriformis, Strain CCMP717" /LENGTH=84 /DNA_ID=CAMNT_0025044041 /DNA_START=14 /DNA_END=265 /DNA_ORIENTATION=-
MAGILNSASPKLKDQVLVVKVRLVAHGGAKLMPPSRALDPSQGEGAVVPGANVLLKHLCADRHRQIPGHRHPLWCSGASHVGDL